MRIAHVITRLIVGGAQENTVLSCEGLAASGHEVTLIAGPETGPEGSLWGRATRFKGATIRVESMRRSVRPLCELRCVGELTAIFAGQRFDVVHTHSSKAGIVGRYAARRAGTPVVVHTIHGMSFNRTQSVIVRAFYRALERRAARWTDAFVCVADAMKTQAVAAGLADPARFVTIRSGMETHLYNRRPADRQAVRREWNIPGGAVVVGTVARLFRNKGYEHLLDAMPVVVDRCPDVRFVWIGDGADRSRYEAKLDRLGIRDRVHLTGLVEPTEIPRLMNGLDVLVHASMWEGLARALVQAGLTEVPAVSFDNDGAPEVVRDGETGYLVPVGDARLLAERIVQMVTDPERRLGMGIAARQTCLGMFDSETMVRKLGDLYADLLGLRRKVVPSPPAGA